MITFIRKVRDRRAFEEYRRAGIASLEGTNAILRIMPGGVHVLEGEPVEMVSMVEFPSLAEAQAWYYSPEYQKLVQMRLAAADCQAVMVEGM